jgi:hypothetical protein
LFSKLPVALFIFTTLALAVVELTPGVQWSPFECVLNQINFEMNIFYNRANSILHNSACGQSVIILPIHVHAYM